MGPPRASFIRVPQSMSDCIDERTPATRWAVAAQLHREV